MERDEAQAAAAKVQQEQTGAGVSAAAAHSDDAAGSDDVAGSAAELESLRARRATLEGEVGVLRSQLDELCDALEGAEGEEAEEEEAACGEGASPTQVAGRSALRAALARERAALQAAEAARADVVAARASEAATKEYLVEYKRLSEQKVGGGRGAGGWARGAIRPWPGAAG